MKSRINKFIQSITITCIIVPFSACSSVSDTQTFEIVIVKRKNISTSILATGIIKPKIGAEVRVGSRASGVVNRLYVKNGDVVKKGDLLAELNDNELSARYRLELANLENTKTILKYSKIELERGKSLLDQDFASNQTYDNLVKEYDLAIARVASQQAAVDLAATELGYAKIYAPISGVIASVSTQEGETVSATFTSPTFVTIIDLSQIEVWAYVDETDIGKVDMRQKAGFTVDTYTGTTFEGIVTAIYPKAEVRDNVVNYVVIVEISDARGKILRPEMTTSVTIQTSSAAQVLCVPNHVIKRKNGENVVYALENDVPVMKKIKPGTKGNQFTEVIEGLEENEIVITNVEENIK